MKRIASIIGIAALSAAMAGTATADQAASDSSSGKASCFNVRNWDGWSSPEDNVLYLKVGMRDVWKVELSGGGKVDRIGSFLVSEHRGSSQICSPMDLDLSLSDHFGFKTPLMARSLTKLSPEQVAAIPAKDRP